MTHWLLVDASFVATQAFYGEAGRDPAAAVLIAVANAERIARRFDAHGTAWAFDSKPYHRSADLPSYKVKPPQDRDEEEMERVAEFRAHVRKLGERYLGALGYANAWAFKGFEADDVIASAVRAAPKDVRFTVVSRDRDLFQLISPRVWVFDPVAGDTHTVASFRAARGIHPSQWPDVKALAGCPTDRVPGCPGVAELTAAKFVRGDPVGGARCRAIRDFMESPDYARNVKLVTLPYPGTPAVVPERDRPRPPGAWRSLTESLDRPGVGSGLDDHKSWRRD